MATGEGPRRRRRPVRYRDRMLGRALVALLVVAVGLLPQRFAAADLTGAEGPPMDVAWRTTLATTPLSGPVVADGIAISGVVDGGVTAVDLATREVLWRTSESTEGWAPEVAAIAGLAIAGDDDGGVVASRIASGETAWRFQSGGPVRQRVAFGDGVVFAASSDGFLYALSLEDGRQLWRFRTTGIASAPVAAGGLVVLGEAGGDLIALDARSGLPVWRNATAFVPGLNPAVGDGILVSRAEPSVAVGLDPTTGVELWWRQLDQAPISAAIRGDLLVLGAAEGHLFGLDTATGAPLWRFRADGAFGGAPTVTAEAVLVYSNDGYVYAIDPARGVGLWRVWAPGGMPGTQAFPLSTPAVDGDTVYVGSLDGALLAIRPSGIEPPAPLVPFARGDAAQRGVLPGPGTGAAPGVLWRMWVGQGGQAGPVVGGDGALYLRDAEGRLSAVDRATGAIRWQVGVAHPVGSPTLTKGSLFVLTSDATVAAFDTVTGLYRWTAPDLQSSFAPIPAEGLVVASHEGRTLVALDAVAGTERWRWESGTYLGGSPAIADGRVVQGGDDGALVALDLLTGAEHWRFSVDGAAWTTPAIDGSTVYAGADDGSFHALDAATGTPLWRFAAERAIAGAPTLAGDLVVVASEDGRVYGIDRASGAERWRFATEQRLGGPPVAAGGVVFFGSDDDHVYALDAATGGELWRLRTGGDVRVSPVVLDGTAFATSADGYLYALQAGAAAPAPLFAAEARWAVDAGDPVDFLPTLVGDLVLSASGFQFVATDRATGQERWRLATVGGYGSSPLVLGDRAYVVTADGRLLAVDLASGTVVWDVLVEERGGLGSGSSLAIDRGALFVALPGRVVASYDAAGNPRWTRTVLGSFGALLAVDDGAVFVAGPAAELIALDAATGEERFGIDSPGAVAAVETQEDRLVLSGDCFVAAVDRNTLEPIWTTGFKGQLRSVQERDGTVLAVGDETVALDPATGEIRWRSPLAWSWPVDPVVVADRLILQDGENLVAALDRTRGETAWSTDIGGAVTSAQTLIGGQVVVGRADGALVAIDPVSGASSAVFEGLPVAVDLAVATDSDGIVAANDRQSGTGALFAVRMPVAAPSGVAAESPGSAETATYIGSLASQPGSVGATRSGGEVLVAVVGAGQGFDGLYAGVARPDGWEGAAVRAAISPEDAIDGAIEQPSGYDEFRLERSEDGQSGIYLSAPTDIDGQPLRLLAVVDAGQTAAVAIDRAGRWVDAEVADVLFTGAGVRATVAGTVLAAERRSAVVASALTVDLWESAMSPSGLAIAAEEATELRFVNRGAATLNLSIEGLNVAIALPAQSQRTVRVSAPAGTYEIVSEIADAEGTAVLGTIEAIAGAVSLDR